MEYCQKYFQMWQENSTKNNGAPTRTRSGQSAFAVMLEQASTDGDSSLGVSSLMMNNNILV